jgi:hypothetical protein
MWLRAGRAPGVIGGSSWSNGCAREACLALVYTDVLWRPNIAVSHASVLPIPASVWQSYDKHPCADVTIGHRRSWAVTFAAARSRLHSLYCTPIVLIVQCIRATATSRSPAIRMACMRSASRLNDGRRRATRQARAPTCHVCSVTQGAATIYSKAQ